MYFMLTYFFTIAVIYGTQCSSNLVHSSNVREVWICYTIISVVINSHLDWFWEMWFFYYLVFRYQTHIDSGLLYYLQSDHTQVEYDTFTMISSKFWDLSNVSFTTSKGNCGSTIWPNWASHASEWTCNWYFPGINNTSTSTNVTGMRLLFYK